MYKNKPLKSQCIISAFVVAARFLYLAVRGHISWVNSGPDSLNNDLFVMAAVGYLILLT